MEFSPEAAAETSSATRPEKTATLAARTAKAGVWTIGTRLVSKVIDFITLLILARFLGPPEFGLVAIAATTVTVVDTILEMPLGAPLIRMRPPSDSMFATAFTIGICRGCIIAAILGCLAWPLSYFYNEPRLAPLICVLSISAIMRSLGSPRMILFTQRFDFRRDLVLEGTGKLASMLVGGTIAVTTGSYWALAACAITTPTVGVILSHIFAPQRLSFTLREWPLFADVVGWNMLAQIVSAVNWQMDKILLPRFIDIASFGRFAMASDISAIPFQAIVHPTVRPLMVAYAEKGSRAAIGYAYGNALSSIMTITAPVFLTMSLLSKPLIQIVFDQKWLAAAPIMNWLALISVITVPAMLLPPLAIMLNRTRFVALQKSADFLVKLPLMLVAVSIAGIKGAIVTLAFTSVCGLVVSMWSVREMIGLTFKAQFLAIAKPVPPLCAIAAIMYSAEPLISNQPLLISKIISLAVVGALVAVAYAASIYVVWRLKGRPDGHERLVFDKLSKMRLLPVRAK